LCRGIRPLCPWTGTLATRWPGQVLHNAQIAEAADIVCREKSIRSYRQRPCCCRPSESMTGWSNCEGCRYRKATCSQVGSADQTTGSGHAANGDRTFSVAKPLSLHDSPCESVMFQVYVHPKLLLASKRPPDELCPRTPPPAALQQSGAGRCDCESNLLRVCNSSHWWRTVRSSPVQQHGGAIRPAPNQQHIPAHMAYCYIIRLLRTSSAKLQLERH
jgi:hypothetical protein